MSAQKSYYKCLLFQRSLISFYTGLLLLNQFLAAQGVRSQFVRKVSDQTRDKEIQGQRDRVENSVHFVPLSLDPLVPSPDVAELIADRRVECVINIPKRTADETVLTDGYRIRRAAADFGIPLINDGELARLFIRALLRHPRQGLDAKPLSAYATRSRPASNIATGA